MSKSAAPDVLVAGGGPIGLAIAWRAAERGLAVAVADDAPGAGASAAAAGMLAPVTEIHYGEESLFRLAAESSRRYPDFVAGLEEISRLHTGYRQTGTMMVAPSADDYSFLKAIHGYQIDLGLEVSRLTTREARALEPALAPGIRGAFLVEGDHAVDSRLLTTALLKACRARGVEMIPNRVAAIETAGERVVAVSLTGGEPRSFGTLVLSAGCWSGSIPGLPAGAVPPVRPVKGQLLYLGGPVDNLLVRRNLRGAGIYIVPRSDGRIVLGASVEERGFDVTVTAGAVYELLRDAYEIVPDLRECSLLETIAGLRPGTPDNAPLLGKSSLEGLVIATGHYRNGILLTPVTADEIVELLVTGKTSDVIEPFSPRRFVREVA